MRLALTMTVALLPLQTACAQENSAAAPATEAGGNVSEEAIFSAAGFTQENGVWSKCGDPGTASYTEGAIEQRGDFNSDGRPDAVVTEGSAYCFGDTGTGYTLVSQRADGGWAILDEQAGVLSFLAAKGADGWPDISVGGPGFCFPVLRWNGHEFSLDRHEYEGKACAG